MRPASFWLLRAGSSASWMKAPRRAFASAWGEGGLDGFGRVEPFGPDRDGGLLCREFFGRKRAHATYA